MADYLVTDTELTSIAAAIRSKRGTSATLSFPTQFVSNINAIVKAPANSDAVLLVIYPKASTLTVKKSSTSLTAVANWITASNSALRCAMFVVSSSAFDSSTAWTISISNGTLTNTKTVTISTNKVYRVEMTHDIIIINQGVRDTSITQTLLRLTESSGEIGTVNGYRKYTQNTSTEPLYVSFGPIDLTNYKTISITMKMTGNASGESEKDKFGVGTTVGGYTTVNTSARGSSKTTKTLDISNLSKNYYITLRCTWSGNVPTFYIYNLAVLA